MAVKETDFEVFEALDMDDVSKTATSTEGKPQPTVPQVTNITH